MGNFTDKILFFKEQIENDSKFENLLEIENLQKENNLTELEDIEISALLIRYYIEKANYKQSFKRSVELKEKCEKISHLPFVLLSISFILESLHPLGREKENDGMIQIGNDILNKISEDSSFETQKIIGHFLFILGLIFQRRQHLEKALDLFKRALIVQEKIHDKMGMAKSLLHISNHYEIVSQFDLALKFLKESLEYSTSFKPNMCSAWAYLHLAYINVNLGNLDEVYVPAKKGVEISQIFGNTHCKDLYFDIMGNYYRELGKYSKSLEYFKRSLFYKKQRNNIGEIADCYYSIATVYSYMGDLNLALDYYQKLLSIKEVIDKDSYRHVYILSLYGKILGEKGEYDEAIKNLEKALALSQDYHNSLVSARIIYYLICISLDKPDYSKAKQYLEESTKIAKTNKENKNIKQIHQLNRALLLKNSDRYRDKLNSQTLFQEIIDDEKIQIEVTIDAMLNLIEILLFELKLSGNEKILREIHEISSKLFDLAHKDNYSSLFAEIMFFQGKMALIEGNIERSRSLLSSAQSIAEKNGLERLANDISNEHDSLLSQMNKWENLIEDKIPLKERLENVKYNFLFSKAVRNLNQEVIYEKEKPFFILIWSQKGLQLFELPFEELDTNIKQNIVGVLTAIEIVGKEALLSKGSIDRIKFDEKTIIIRVKDQIKFAYAFTGQSYYALKKLELFISKITTQPQIWNNLIKCELTGEILNRTLYNSIIAIVHQIF